MLTDHELESLFLDIESDRVERKENAADPKKIQQVICAFANDMPGYQKPGVLFVGVKDDGTCANLRIDDQLLLTLSQLRSTGNILPLPSMTVQKKTILGCDVAVVVVEPSTLPPVRFKGRTWIRIGPQRDTATIEQERQLTERRRAADKPWDLQPLPSASLDDLDLNCFRQVYLPAAIDEEIIRENNRSIEDQLRSLRFIGLGSNTPTVTGMLTTGISPTNFVPGAYVQFLRIQGTEFSDPIRNQRAIHGPITTLIPQLDLLMEANIEIATDITSGPVEIRKPNYPVNALAQLTRNAVMHRSYEGTNAPIRIYWFDDRIEIHNPGGPYGDVSIETFGKSGFADYRNPNLAAVMKDLGFVQQFGVGISTARRLLAANHNPELEFSVTANHVCAIVRRRA